MTIRCVATGGEIQVGRDGAQCALALDGVANLLYEHELGVLIGALRRVHDELRAARLDRQLTQAYPIAT